MRRPPGLGATCPTRRTTAWRDRRRERSPLLSFWLCGNLIYTGQNDKALDLFHDVITNCTNHLGLFAEMYDKPTGRQLGNFPQAYSHIGLIHTALNLSGYIADTPTRRINPL